jgi:hypothetical protein
VEPAGPVDDVAPEAFKHPERIELSTGHHLRPTREADIDIDYLGPLGPSWSTRSILNLQTDSGRVDVPSRCIHSERNLQGDHTMAQALTLYVCHGDDGGPRRHPCRRVQEALRAAGIEYEKVIAAHGHPIPFLRKGSREELREATGDTKLPALKLPDGTVLAHSRPILAWISHQK